MGTKSKKHANSVVLKLDTLGHLSEGFAQAVIDAALSAAMRDTEDRGGDKKERKVVITVRMKKLGDTSIVTQVEADAKIPKYVTPETIGDLIHNGRDVEMHFSSAAADNPDQPALPGMGHDEE